MNLTASDSKKVQYGFDFGQNLEEIFGRIKRDLSGEKISLI